MLRQYFSFSTSCVSYLGRAEIIVRGWWLVAVDRDLYIIIIRRNRTGRAPAYPTSTSPRRRQFGAREEDGSESPAP